VGVGGVVGVAGVAGVAGAVGARWSLTNAKQRSRIQSMKKVERNGEVNEVCEECRESSPHEHCTDCGSALFYGRSSDPEACCSWECREMAHADAARDYTASEAVAS
jgi:predicted nucleic acid-binding Zn ribbon protein